MTLDFRLHMNLVELLAVLLLGNLEISTRVEGILGVGEREERKEGREGSSSNGVTACVREQAQRGRERAVFALPRGGGPWRSDGRTGVKYYTCRYGAGC